MSLLDDAKEESEISRRGNKAPCTIAALDADLRAEINEALATPGVTDAGLEKALAKREVTFEGRSIKASTLGRHRRGGCTCESG